jgi:hypothetical protein
MSTYINRTINSCFYHLRQLKIVRRNLPFDAAKSLAHCLILMRLDYCNRLLASIPDFKTDRMQSVLNATARIVCGADRLAHITPLLRDRLHWLKCHERVTFKLCLVVYKALHGLAPAYISDFCEPVSDTNYRCQLRSATISDLVVPRSCTNFGDRAFRVAGPSAWNSLPPSIRLLPSVNLFKAKLKAHLFTVSYKLNDLQG